MTDESADNRPGAQTERSQLVGQASLPADPSGDDAVTGRTHRIDRDLYCVRCAYNLRTLTPDARCPECGHPVAETLREETYSPRLRSLRRYTGFYLLACTLGILLGFLYTSSYLVYWLSDYPDIFRIIDWPAAILRWAVLLIAAYAIFQLTRSHMLARGGPQYRTLRWSLRAGIVLELSLRTVGFLLLSSLGGSQSHWYFARYVALYAVQATFLLLLLYFLWRLLTPCPHTIAQRLRRWGQFAVAHLVVYAVLILLRMLEVEFPNWLPGFPELGWLGVQALYLAVYIAAVQALLAIRRHLADRLHIRDNPQILETAHCRGSNPTSKKSDREGESP